MFPYSPDSAYDSVVYYLVKTGVGVGSSSARISQSQCTFPQFVIGLVLPFLLVLTPTPCFHLIVYDGNISGIGRCFLLIVKFYASDYDSDSDSDSVDIEYQSKHQEKFHAGIVSVNSD